MKTFKNLSQRIEFSPIKSYKFLNLKESINIQLTISTLALIVLMSGCDDDPGVDNLTYPDNVRFRSEVNDGNGKSIVDASVVVWANDNRYGYRTDGSGEYDFLVPLQDLPSQGEVGLSIYKDGYKPFVAAYTAPLYDDTIYELRNPSMDECPNCIRLTNSRAHELIHLGDDSFGGSINSQFQKSSDSDIGVRINFVAPASGRFRVFFEAKGVQCPNTIYYGNKYYTLDSSPSNGGFRSYSFIFDADPNVDSIEIYTSVCSGTDKDDWEFIGLYIEAI